MGEIKCFLIEKVHDTPLPHPKTLRRLRSHEDRVACPANPKLGYCDAEVDLVVDPSSEIERAWGWVPGNDDPRWPTRCACGYQFVPRDPRVTSWRNFWRRVDTGEIIEMQNAPPGAMWFADWLTDGHCQYQSDQDRRMRGPDGRCLVVRIPGGDWVIDSRCSNCDKKSDNEHKCWVRHGEPPNITVDKNGLTCGAGAGSIMMGSYHAHLVGGVLREC